MIKEVGFQLALYDCQRSQITNMHSIEIAETNAQTQGMFLFRYTVKRKSLNQNAPIKENEKKERTENVR